MPVTAFTVHSDFNMPIISPSASPLPKTTPHRWERTWKRLKMSSALLFQKAANLFSRKASVPAKRGCCASVPTVAWPWDRPWDTVSVPLGGTGHGKGGLIRHARSGWLGMDPSLTHKMSMAPWSECEIALWNSTRLVSSKFHMVLTATKERYFKLSPNCITCGHVSKPLQQISV